MVLAATYPCAAKVEGNMYENVFQNSGMFDEGQAIPDTNSSMMLKAGNITSAASRLRKNDPNVIAKKAVASMKGTISASSVPTLPTCGRWNRCGISIMEYTERAV